MLSMMRTIHAPSEKRQVYVRACDCDASSLSLMVEDMPNVVDVLSLADLGEGKRELYQFCAKPVTEWFVG
jgi:hypothetical protein